LGPEALPLKSPGLLPRLRTGWTVAHGTVATLCLVGGALFFASDGRVNSPPSAAPHGDQQQHVPVDVHTPQTGSSEATIGPGAEPVRSSARLRSSRRTHQRPDHLAQEVALMSRATSALKAGRADEALRLLSAHQQRFASGVLKQERQAAKAQALCLLGRPREGRAELANLAPGSPTAASARAVCDAASKQGEPN
jgi:hypothetical protein